MSAYFQPDPFANNLVVNGDFENLSQGVGYGTRAFGWTSAGAVSGVFGHAGYTHRVEDHGYALGGWTSATGQSIAQTIETDIGTAYSLVFDAGVYFGGLGAGVLDIEIEGASGTRKLASLGVDSLSGGNTFSLDLVALDAQSTIRFVYNGQGAYSTTDIDLDNIGLFARSPEDDAIRVRESESAGDLERLSDTGTGVLANDAPGSEVVTVNGDVAAVGQWLDLDKGRVLISTDGTIDFDADGDFDALLKGESETVTIEYTTAVVGTGELIVNGDFESHGSLQYGAGGNRFGFFDSVEGWTTVSGAIEIQQGTFGGTPLNSTTNSVIELDSHGRAGTNAHIQQNVTIATDGTYTFSFDYAPRYVGSSTALSNELNVWVDGAIVDTIVTGEQGYQRYDYTLDLAEGSHSVGFSAGGRADGSGPLIDNVSLQGEIAQTAMVSVEVLGEGTAPVVIPKPGNPGVIEKPGNPGVPSEDANTGPEVTGIGDGVGVSVGIEGSTSLGGIDLSGSAGAEAQAGAYIGSNGYYVGAYAQAEMQGSASVDLGEGVSLDVNVGATAFAGAYKEFYVDGTTARVGGKAGAGITGEASADVGVDLGDGQVGAGTDVEVNVGAIASGDAEANFGDGQYGAGGEGGAFAGAGVSVTVRSEAGYDDVGSAGGGAGGSVGNVGVGGGGNAGYEDGKISFGLSGDVAAGLGVKFDFQVEIDTHYLQEGALALADSAAVQAAASVVADAAGAAAEATAKAAEDFANGAVAAAQAAADLAEEAEEVLGALGETAARTAQIAADAVAGAADAVADGVASAAEDAAEAIVDAAADAQAAAVAAAEAAQAAAEETERLANAAAQAAAETIDKAKQEVEDFVANAYNAHKAAVAVGVGVASEFQDFMDSQITEVFGDVLGDFADEIFVSLDAVIGDIGNTVKNIVGDAVDGFIGGIGGVGGAIGGIFSFSLSDESAPAPQVQMFPDEPSVPEYVSQDVLPYIPSWIGSFYPISQYEQKLNDITNAGEPILKALAEAALREASAKNIASTNGSEAAASAALADMLTGMTAREYAAHLAWEELEAAQAVLDEAKPTEDLDFLTASIDANEEALEALAPHRAEAQARAQTYRDALVALDDEPLSDAEKAQRRSDLEDAIDSVMAPVDAQDAQLRALIDNLTAQRVALEQEFAPQQATVDALRAKAEEAQLRSDYHNAQEDVDALEEDKATLEADIERQEDRYNDAQNRVDDYYKTLRDLQNARDRELVRLEEVLEYEKQQIDALENAAFEAERAFAQGRGELGALTPGSAEHDAKLAEVSALEAAVYDAWDAYNAQYGVIYAAEEAVYRHRYQGDNDNYGGYQAQMLEEIARDALMDLYDLEHRHFVVSEELDAAYATLNPLAAAYSELDPLEGVDLEALEEQLKAVIGEQNAELQAEADAAQAVLDAAQADYDGRIAEAEAAAQAAETEAEIAAAQDASTQNKAAYLASDEGKAQIAAALEDAQAQLAKAQLFYAENDHARAVAAVVDSEKDLASLTARLADVLADPSAAPDDAEALLRERIEQAEAAHVAALQSAQSWTRTLSNLIENNPIDGEDPARAAEKLAELDGLLAAVNDALVPEAVNLTEDLRGIATASHSSTYGWWSADLVLDGNADAKNWNHTWNGANEHVEVDLKDAQFITRVEVTNRGDGWGHRLNGAEVVLFDASGTEVHRFAPIAGAGTGAVLTFETDAPLEAQFVRVEHHNQYLHVSEIEVFGLPTGNASDAVEENLTQSLKGVATASASSVGWGGNAAAVLDGSTAGGNWAHTYNGANEHVEVDLKGEHGITRLEVTNRTDGWGDRLNGAEVVLFDASGSEVHRFAPITDAQTGEVLMFTTGSPLDAQYIRIEHHNQYLHVAEIEVFGTPGNQAPIVTVDDQVLASGSDVALADLLQVVDPDADEIALYEIWDSVGASNVSVSGASVDASAGYTVSDLSDVRVQADAEAGSQVLWVRANDGAEWGSWDTFELTTIAYSDAEGASNRDIDASAVELVSGLSPDSDLYTTWI